MTKPNRPSAVIFTSNFFSWPPGLVKVMTTGKPCSFLASTVLLISSPVRSSSWPKATFEGDRITDRSDSIGPKTALSVLAMSSSGFSETATLGWFYSSANTDVFSGCGLNLTGVFGGVTLVWSVVAVPSSTVTVIVSFFDNTTSMEASSASISAVVTV